MQHPFINDLSDKSIEDLQKSILDLTSKLIFSSRMQNVRLANQIQMVLESYKTEYAKRMAEVYKKQNMENHINISNHH